ncbi:BadF/BadG/BcrA/BcrD ATPase family protein [Kitasatospora sp. NPDC049285]|uniref:N-acetylglucosamine kinase n=1 Tax=Kitasatospora sp. NPDC049285 TaxID=3157096 RepID=UPI00342BB706
MTPALVLGVDAGGTRTRVAVADTAGHLLARAEGPAGNPVAHGVPAALDALRITLARALAGLDPAAVRSAVLALAGDHLLADGEGAAALTATLRGLGLHGLSGPHRLIGDAVAAFAAATPEPHGALLIAGTGAVAVRLHERAIADTAGGYGWLLGDEGSGFWLGREAVRTAADTLRGRADAHPLTRLVLARLLPPTDRQDASSEASDAPVPRVPVAPDRVLAERLLSAAYTLPPVELSTLAPLVTRAAGLGDGAADAILDRAAAHLDALLAQVRPHPTAAPVVLAGTCLAPHILGARTARLLAGRGPATLHHAPDGTLGATWLAALPVLTPADPTPAALHAALTAEGA